MSREGQVKTQIILSVSESLALMLQKQKTAKDTWDALVNEMTKKPKMVLTSLHSSVLIGVKLMYLQCNKPLEYIYF